MENVLELIPQREPFLFVDKVISRSDNKITTSFLCRPDLACFKGHFPSNPIMPGVLLQEALFQTGACLMAKLQGLNGLGVVTKVENARFKSMVRPNDELIMEVELTENIQNAYYFKGNTKVDGKTVLSINFTCASI